MTIKGILFDKDGTLIAFEENWHKVYQRIFNELESVYRLPKEAVRRLKDLSGFQEAGFKKESLIQYASVETIITLWIEAIEPFEVFGRRKKVITKKTLRALMKKHSEESEVQVIPLENTVKTIKELHRRGYILGVITADTPESTSKDLNRLGIESYFSFIGTDDGYFKRKPDPDMGKEFCRKFQLQSKEVLYVGDSITDMTFAENNGFYFAGIKSEYNEYETFIRKGYPVIENIGELEEALLTGE